jgi:biotin-(acetyl-CoA carboxylase) ligase
LLPALTLALGLAAADAICRNDGPRVRSSRPNDVMLEGRTVAGILVQLLDSAPSPVLG